MIELVLNLVFLSVALMIIYFIQPRWLKKQMEQLPEYLELFGSQVTKSAKGILMGTASGDARGKKAVLKAVAEDMIDQSNPVLSTALNAFPAVKELLIDNPNLVPIALTMLGNFNLGGNGSGKGQSSPNDFAQRLKEYGG